MKKNVLIKTLVIALMLAGSATANAQIDLGSILGSLTGKSSSKENTSSTTNLLSGLTNIFSSEKQASKNNLVGTWEYSEPAIVFESDNLLAKAGASIASSKIEDKLQEQLSKFGFESGAFSITFNEDGTFSTSFNRTSFPGQYTFSQQEKTLELDYGRNEKLKGIALKTNVSVGTSSMQLLFNADKLLEFISKVTSSAGDSKLGALTSLLDQYDGMQIGFELKRVK